MLPSYLLRKLQSVGQTFYELTRRMADPDVAKDPQEFQRIAKLRSSLEETVQVYEQWQKVQEERDSTQQLLKETTDQELKELASLEVAELMAKLQHLEERLQVLLLPQDPNDDKNIMLEIRAGTGGEEASIWAADLVRMYSRYAEQQGWRVKLVSESLADMGGFKEAILEIQGDRVYSKLKYESGVHRVQRVPVTEAGGRVHTSTATVAVLPEMSEVEVEINPNDVRIDVFRAGGPGGQSVNTTDSAVRVTHLPTGLVVSCQDEKSQLQNRARAMQILRARLHAMEMERKIEEQSEARRSQVGTGERSEKVRTYNFPQNRVTDHRIGLTLHRLDSVLEGDLDELIEGLMAAELKPDGSQGPSSH